MKLADVLRRRWRYVAFLAGGLLTWWWTLPTTLSAPTDHAALVPSSFVISAESPTTTLPSTLSRPRLDAAQRDPFSPNTPPPANPPVLQPIQPPVAAVVLPPSAPNLDLQFAGRMVKPDGGTLIYATHGNEAVTLSQGQQLANGYKVEAVTAQAVEFSHAALGITARLALPQAPAYEVR